MIIFPGISIVFARIIPIFELHLVFYKYIILLFPLSLSIIIFGVVIILKGHGRNFKVGLTLESNH